MCVVGRDRQVEVDRLWSAWKRWCETENRAPGTKGVFGRDLHAATPTVLKTNPMRPRRPGGVEHVHYLGAPLMPSLLLKLGC